MRYDLIAEAFFCPSIDQFGKYIFSAGGKVVAKRWLFQVRALPIAKRKFRLQSH